MSQTLANAAAAYQSGDFATASELARAILRKEQSAPVEVYALLGNASIKLGRQEAAADAFLEGARKGGPSQALFSKLALTLYRDIGRTQGVAAAGSIACPAHPEDQELQRHYLRALFATGQYREIVTMTPLFSLRDPDAQSAIINAHRLTGEFVRLNDWLTKAIAAEPRNLLLLTTRYVVARETCDMAVNAEFAQRMGDLTSPVARAILGAEPALARIFWGTSDAINGLPTADSLAAAQLPSARHRRSVTPGKKPVIGYLSSDFFDHATMRLLADVLVHHDRESFDIRLFCYSGAAVRDWQARHLPVDLFASLTDVSTLTDPQAAAAVDEAGVDLLVDLKGHTMMARPGIAKLSSAPVKATWLGFPGSVKGAGFDYAITDRVVTPDEAAAYFEEKLCRLPECYQPNAPSARPEPIVSRRADHGLPEDRVVFASFNATQKISPDTLALWASVLRAVEGAVMWIWCDKAQARDNLRAGFATHGIDPSRILFQDAADPARHLGRLALADLALDTFPCTGHTTTSDQLWMGLPVLTMQQDSFAGRVSASLLTAMGMPELIAKDRARFVELAVALAEDRPRLSALRQTLLDRRLTASLFDARRFTRHLELAFTAMLERAGQGDAPALIDIAALPRDS